MHIERLTTRLRDDSLLAFPIGDHPKYSATRRHKTKGRPVYCAWRGDRRSFCHCTHYHGQNFFATLNAIVETQAENLPHIFDDNGARPSTRLAHSDRKPAPHLDFRSFVDELRSDNDLADINAEVDPHLEVAAIIRRAYEVRSKAPLFNNVRGARDGLFRILGAPGGLSHDSKYPYKCLARHLSLPPTARLNDVIDRMLSAKGAAPIPPVHVSDGPCKEVKIFGDDIDLTRLPVPLLNKADGGNYIQTLGINIALGAPPIAVMAASMPLPQGVSEAEYVGSLCGSPLELVKCETNDMCVPVNSEIVLEGTISVKDRCKEGPFGEIQGYSFLDENSLQPLYKVSAITHRKNPILPVCVPGRATGPDKTHTMIGTLAAAEIKHLLQQDGLPVMNVFTPFESQVIWAAVQIDRAKLAKLSTNANELCNKIRNMIHRLLIVGDDIDPFRFEDVTWAFASRCRPSLDEFHFEDVPAYPLVSSMSHGIGTKVTGGKVVGNCLLPSKYKGEQGWVTCDFENGYLDDLKKRVLLRWAEFGL
ncbi:uncharacterized protein A1O9_00918 [Exophiala aquamarina CBS 119918]|uniref:Ferulic acid decarboxylase 1 n=1 Tax=Exophiala aquamarina CBS 119918 TaxID=1182545 RepID=A0A072PS70_9EURO|nr:uncharacterized protein A1O9_00918 [Exophiala aquamarina CBS 119918]KEF62944.1 hypothetical protein A1O9_00918 [Exophiala aquamarina CBS 119918]